MNNVNIKKLQKLRKSKTTHTNATNSVESKSRKYTLQYIHTTSGKRCHYTFVPNFVKCWPIFKIIWKKTQQL